MKYSFYHNICRHSAKRIKNYLNRSKNQLLIPSQSPPQTNGFTLHHKCDYIKLTQILSHMDKLSIQEFEVSKFKSKEFQEKQLEIHIPSCTGVPMTTLDQGIVSTQCCINQKHVNHFFLSEGKKPQDLFGRRDIQRRLREYLLAIRQLKSMTHTVPNTRKYQIDILIDENPEERMNRPIDWTPLKMEERHFRIGHTIKHP